LGAPYAKFPDDVSSEIDILSITRTWTFTKEDSLASE
jgi:protein TonB